ncbi:MAG: glycosyltransferase family 4 protein [Candidatus Omnitrophica bacterium]|nr:glycosyltransferase family 4 protein [Candidatus Omnitrophota bacterium]
MKIAILGPYPYSSDIKNISGGVQAVVVNMVQGLSKFKDLDIHVVTSSHLIDKDTYFTHNGISIHTVPAEGNLGNVTFYSKTRKAIHKKLDEIKPDLVHAHMLGYYTLAALDKGYKRVVVSTHGLFDSSQPSFYDLKAKIRSCFQICMSIRCMKKTENFILNSPFARKYLSRQLRHKNIYELNNPVSDSFFNIDRDSEEEGRLLFVGNISRAKGLMVLLHAINIVKKGFGGIRLRIAGQTREDKFYQQLLGFIKENGLDNHVQFLGSLNEEELKEEYKKASMFVFPSQQDVAPLALLQAMAAGKAIVTTRVGGIPYIIDDGVNGFLVDKQDFMGLAEKIALFMKEPALRKRFGLNAHTKVFEDYRIDEVSRKLYEIYNGMFL